MCLDDQILSTYLDNELVQPWKDQVEEHIRNCTACSNRYLALLRLHEHVKNAQIDDESIKKHKDHVLSYLENNVLNSEKKSSFLKKQIKFSFSQFVGVAAAFVIVFVGSLALVSGKSRRIDVPQINSLDINNVSPVSYTQSESLDSYTIEELLQNLESRGLIVTVQLKTK